MNTKSRPPAAKAKPHTQLVTATRRETHVYEGPIPHPDQLAEFDRIIPGAAREILDMAKAQAKHSHWLEVETTKANVLAQQRQIDVETYRVKSVFRSDLVGQGCGALVSMACIGGAVYLAMSGHEWGAVTLAAIPTAAVIQAFFAKRAKP